MWYRVALSPFCYKTLEEYPPLTQHLRASCPLYVALSTLCCNSSSIKISTPPITINQQHICKFLLNERNVKNASHHNMWSTSLLKVKCFQVKLRILARRWLPMIYLELPSRTLENYAAAGDMTRRTMFFCTLKACVAWDSRAPSTGLGMELLHIIYPLQQ